MNFTFRRQSGRTNRRRSSFRRRNQTCTRVLGKVVPIAETASDLFYGKLFELNPKLKALFRKT